MKAIDGVLDIITIGLIMYSVVLIIETIYTIVKGIKHIKEKGGVDNEKANNN